MFIFSHARRVMMLFFGIFSHFKFNFRPASFAVNQTNMLLVKREKRKTRQMLASQLRLCFEAI